MKRIAFNSLQTKILFYAFLLFVLVIVIIVIIGIQVFERVPQRVAQQRESELARVVAGQVELAASLRPDLILLDLVMPRMDGIEAIRGIRQDDPEARILVLTSFSEDEKVLTAIAVGAAGCLLKDATPEELLKAIHDVHQGRSALNPTIAQKLIEKMRKTDAQEPVEELTSREVEVLRCLARGLSNREIGDKLFISEPTVRTHVSNILMKLELPNRTQAALFALREGLVSLE